MWARPQFCSHGAKETHEKYISSTVGGWKAKLKFSGGADTCIDSLGQTGIGIQSREGKKREINGVGRAFPNKSSI